MSLSILFKILKIFLQGARRDTWGVLAFSGVLMVVSVVANLYLPYLFKYLLDLLNQKANEVSNISMLGVGYFIVWMFTKANLFIREILFARAMERFKNYLIIKYYNILLKQGLDNNKNVGGNITNFEKIQNSVPHIILSTTLMIIPTLLEFIVILIIIGKYYGAKVFALLVVIFSILLWINVLAGRSLAVLQGELKLGRKSLSQFLYDRLNNIPIIQSENTQALEEQNLIKSLYNQEVMESRYRITIGKLNILSMGAVSILFIYVSSISYYYAYVNLISTNELVLIHFYLISLITPISLLIIVLKNILKSLDDIEEVINLLPSQDTQLISGASTLVRQFNNFSIHLRNINFSYNKESLYSKAIYLDIQQGARVGIVGKSGSGKSTLCKLMAGLLIPDYGEIIIGEKALNQILGAERSRLIGTITQNLGLLNESILFNLTYGLPAYSVSDIDNVIHLLNLEAFISKLPQGLETKIDPFAKNISDGQKQKLLAARLLLKAPKIVILDEATSFMDLETEHTVLEAITLALKDSTFLIVSHRRNTLNSFCNDILNIEHGRVSWETQNHRTSN